MQKQRLETETENGQAGNDPPVSGGHSRGLCSSPASRSCTAITFECVTMISTSRYAWGQTGLLAQSAKREKRSHRKSLFASLCAILLTICKDLYLWISSRSGTVEGARFLTEIASVYPFPRAVCGSSLRQRLHLCLLQVTHFSRPEFLLCKCEPCVFLQLKAGHWWTRTPSI